ncbi:hypothetical protein J4Q44_G00377850 [Coregonus suidteri]|uniref:MACPF domain-containing protein n=1 Tax=Coregonus suidteri TaxID=861788 RepID=A0AAN8KTI0_9TELE
MSGTQTTLVALLWLWGVWLSPVLSSCTTGRPAECKAALSAPGTNLAGEGFDIVTMERKQAYVIDVDNWRKTDNGTCTLCVNPFMEGQTQRLPAAVVDWRPMQKCHMKLASMVYDSSEAFVSSSQTEVDVSWKIGLDIVTPQAKGSVIVGGTHSKAAKTVMSQSKKDKYSFIKQDIHCSYYRPRVDYRHFLGNFGTHFIKKVHLGGRVKSVTSLRVCQASLSGYNENEVKDCLEAEASVATHTGSAEFKTETKFCKTDLKKRDTKDSFSSTFHERFTEVVGGQTDGTTDLLFSKTGGNAKAFADWASSLKTIPDVINYSLNPLHLLVKHAKKRAGLKKAVEDYILEYSLVKHCSGKCKGGSRSSAHDSCECVCQPSKEMTSQCCPQEKGLAHLTVTVQKAIGLWGDVYSETDGFVKVFMDKSGQVDHCHQQQQQPRLERRLGLRLYYSYKVDCTPGLGGSTCGEYVPSGMNSDLSDLYTSRNALNMTQDLLAHIRMGRPLGDPLAFVDKQKADGHPYGKKHK